MRPRKYRFHRLEQLEARLVLTAPTITSFVVSPDAGNLRDPLSLLVNASDVDDDLRDVSFYLDDGDGQFGATDTLLGVDHDPADGWQWQLQTGSPYRILPLGDSITQPEATQQSYRYPLWKNLQDAGYAFDFVGTQTANFNGSTNWPDYLGQSFDPDHEGHYGWRADEILADLPTWLSTETPDVVLMHLGTNDLFQSQSVASTLDDLGQIVTKLRSSNPNVVIFASLLVPTAFPSNQLIDDFNAELPARVAEWNTGQSPVILVDQNSAIDSNLHLYDGVHPNALGEEIMADVWEASIASALPITDPNASFGPGTHSFWAVATDQLNETSIVAGASTELSGPPAPPSVALSESDESDFGVVTGAHTFTHVSDDQYQQITEEVRNGSGLLAHNWRFSIPAGQQATVELEAYHDSPSERFYVNYSTDGSNWRNILTLTKNTDDNQVQTKALPADISGDVWIRIKRVTPADDALNDSVYVDYLGIRLEGTGEPLLPEVQIATTAQPSEQGPSAGQMQLSRTGATDTPLTIAYTVSGTATPATDYVPLTGSVTIPAGSAQATINIQAIEDSELDPNETIVVTLSPNSAYRLGSSSQAIATVADNDQPVGGARSFPIAQWTNWGEATGAGNVFESDDQYQQLLETASPNDALWHTWEFNVPEGTEPELVLEARSTTEAERFYVNYSLDDRSYKNILFVRSTVEQTYRYAFPGNVSGSVYIKVRDSNATEGTADTLFVDQVYIETADTTVTPTLELAFSTASISENAGSAAITGTVTRNAADISNPLVVTLASSDISEASVPTSITIPANAATATFSIDAIDDSQLDGDQSVTISVSATDFVGATGTIQVRDDESPSTIQFVDNVYRVTESVGAVSLALVRTGGVSDAVTVSYATSDGLAVAPGDFTNTVGTATFAAGQTNATIDIPITNDNVPENEETFSVLLTDVSTGAILGAPASRVVTIVDDDQASGTRQYFPITETTVIGSSAGANNVSASDDQYQQLTETGPSNDVLWHTWEFEVTVGTEPELVLEARASSSAERFYVNYSIDDRNYKNMLSVQTTSDTTYRYAFPEGTLGSVYVKVRDSNASQGVSDTLWVDQVYIQTQVEEDVNEPPEPDSGGLVGHWQFEEALIGQTVVDASAFGNHGTHVNVASPHGPSNVAAVGDLSLSTDGVDDYVGIPGDTSLDLSSGQFTQSVWVFPQHADTGFHGILGYQGNGAAQRYPGLWVKDQDKIHAGFGDGVAWNGFSTGSVLTPNAWNHLAATFDGTNYRIYVDGTEVYSTPDLSGKRPYPTQQLDIGRVDNYFDGRIDDIRIYTRVLDSADIGLLTNQGPPRLGTLQMADRDYVVNESSGTVSVEVVRVGGSQGEVSVDYTTVDGSAVAPEDYTAVSGSVSFADGQTSAVIEVPIVDDNGGEGNESFSLSLDATDGGANLGFPRTRLVTIVDDDAPAGSGTGLRAEYFHASDLTDLAFIRTDATVNWDWGLGSPAASMESDTFSVRWTGAVEPVFTETYAFHTTTDDGVRLWVNGELLIDQWVDQQATTASGTIALVGGNRYDIVMEYYEQADAASAKLEWSSQSQALEVIPTARLYDGSSTGPTISLPASITDVDEDAGTATVTVLRFGDTSAASSIQYALTPGTATSGTDYVDATGTLNFAANETSQTITISIVDDVELEAAETFGLTLANPSGAVLGTQSTSQIRILDNDPGNFLREDVVSDLFLPTTFEFAPDGRLFVAQKWGQVLVYDANGNQESTFIDISAEVNHAADRGLLGLALHPNFPVTPYVYLLYAYDPPETQGLTGNAGPDGRGNRVNRMIRVSADPATNFATAVPGSEVVLLGANSTWDNISSPELDSTGDPSIPPSCGPGGTMTDCLPLDSRSHAVGTVKFSADGAALFVSVGDGTSFGIADPRSVRVQDIDSLSGKLLRIDPLTGEGLDDNPFFDGDPTANRSKVYSYGLRNPFRFAVHPTTSEPFIGDVGWTAWEEINTGAGANFGWPYYEGGSGASLQANGYRDLPEAQAFYATGAPVQEPLYARSHTDGATALIMGDFYSGTTFPDVYDGALFFADVNEGSIDFITFDTQGNPEPVRNFANGVPGIVQMATGPDGHLYFTNLAEGKIERFVPGGTSAPTGSGGDGPGGGSAGKSFFVVDPEEDMTYYYQSFVESPLSLPMDTENAAAEGVTALADGSQYWTVDQNGQVFSYDADGVVLGAWAATTTQAPAGIATDGVDLWIVDQQLDEVLFYSEGTTHTSGTMAPTSIFALAEENIHPTGLATDGQFLWVVDPCVRQVFKYTVEGQLVGSWALDERNVDPQGITNDPSGYGFGLWVVDAATLEVFAYADGANYVAGEEEATAVYPLAAENTMPRGIADPIPRTVQPPPPAPPASASLEDSLLAMLASTQQGVSADTFGSSLGSGPAQSKGSSSKGGVANAATQPLQQRSEAESGETDRDFDSEVLTPVSVDSLWAFEDFTPVEDGLADLNDDELDFRLGN